MSDRFPKPYVNNVRKDPMMEYTTFPNTGIGSRPSGMPKSVKKGNLGLDHVGGTASGSK
jgi:hypothetical protein